MVRGGATTWQVVLPESLRKHVMLIAHDTITGGHFGIRKTREKIMSNFYWPVHDAQARDSVADLCIGVNGDVGPLDEAAQRGSEDKDEPEPDEDEDDFIDKIHGQ